MSETAHPKLRKGDIIPIFYEMNVIDIDPELGGPSLLHAFAVDGNGELTVVAMAFDGPETGDLVYETIRKLMREKSPTEVIFNINRHARPGQGTEFDSLQTIHYFDGRAWRFGVAEYRSKPSIEVKPINWSNAWWTKMLQNEIRNLEPPIPIHGTNTPPIVLPPRGERPKDFVGPRTPDVPGVPDHFSRLFPGWPTGDPREIFDAGEWLEQQLRERGAGDELVEQLCQASGQHVAMSDDPWGESERALERFIAGEIEEPGEALAERIFQERMPYFLNMYGTPSRESVLQVIAEGPGKC